MRCTHCDLCCRETQMMLCEADIRRLERAGHPRDGFSSRGEDGTARLSNREGYCVFYDREARRCTEYARRPLGCVIYPVNLTSDGELVIDDSCPMASSVSQRELDEKGRRLRKLLQTISSEAHRRG